MPAPITGQVAISATAQQLVASPKSVAAFTIKAPVGNQNPVYVGDSTVTTSTGHQLDPGDEFDYERLSASGQPVYQLGPSDFWVVGTGGDKVTWLGSPA